MDKKVCKSCGESKLLDAFSKYASSRDGYQYQCKQCYRSWYQEHKKTDAFKASRTKERQKRRTPEGREKLRERRFIKEYGLTLDEYRNMLEEQQYKCYLCSTHHLDERWGLSVDHNHATGAVRKLLCSLCNTGIGCFKDAPDVLERAARYVREMN